MSNTIEDELLDIIATESAIRRENLIPSADLQQLGMDSISYISVGYAIEEKYGVTLDPESLADVTTLSELMGILVPIIQKAKTASHA